MKEFKILAVIVALVGITYYGIEPYAHHVMHPKPEKELDFQFKDLKNVDINLAGNVAEGKNQFSMNCTSCHSLTADGFKPGMSANDAANAFGVVPPDLSLAGRIYEKNYLANFIYDPVTASNLSHKYPAGGTKFHPMPAYNWMSQQNIMDIVAYLEAIAPKAPDMAQMEAIAAEGKDSVATQEKAENKEVFEAACGRCHSMAYAGIKSTTPSAIVSKYMGSTPPDLSQYIKSRGAHYLEYFINDPQNMLHGTAMPRVGLTEEAQNQVIEYMEQIGDPKKAEREALGVNVLIYSVIFAIFALLWKRKIWSEVH
jgi:ubiquinol-cytochrome c reductase cytochrome c1 subunit